VQGRIYVIGGFNGVSPLDVVEEYDPIGNTWTTRTPMPTARSLVAAGAVDGKIYVVGGYNGMTTVEAYDPAADSWTTETSMPNARRNLAAAVVDGVVYLIGGHNGVSEAGQLNVVVRFDPASRLLYAHKKN